MQIFLCSNSLNIHPKRPIDTPAIMPERTWTNIPPIAQALFECSGASPFSSNSSLNAIVLHMPKSIRHIMLSNVHDANRVVDTPFYFP
jgi:hypothetical protein